MGPVRRMLDVFFAQDAAGDNPVVVVDEAPARKEPWPGIPAGTVKEGPDHTSHSGRGDREHSKARWHL